MQWIDPLVKSPDRSQDVLVAVSYLDAEFDMEKGGYDNNKTFWTPPVLRIATAHVDSVGKIHWDCGGKVLKWMPLPEPPKD